MTTSTRARDGGRNVPNAEGSSAVAMTDSMATAIPVSSETHQVRNRDIEAL
jgi:hypothetical protein